MRIRTLATTLLLLTPCITAFAQLSDTEPAIQNACKTFAKAQLPKTDRPTPEEAKALTGCVSENLYYGIGQPADPVKARKCAYVEMDSNSDMIFAGKAMLMTVYAIGKGAKRNIDVALKLACEVEGAPAEIAGRIAHLQSMKADPEEDFDLCDDVTSGFMMGACAGHNEKVDQVKRQALLNGLTAKWSADERQAFQTLQGVFDKFVQSRIENEVDATGTARAAMAIGEESNLRKDFLDALERFEKGQLPHFTAAQFSQADAGLNAAYGKIQRQKNLSAGTVTQKSIRETQRVWLQYRDAWVAFGQKKYPAVSADSWKTWLTQQRTKMLKDFLEQ